MKQLASAFILSKLDYCNSILTGLLKSTNATLQRVQNAAARCMVLNLHPHDSISDGLRQLHWLPIEARIQFKLCLLMHLIHSGRCPSYISVTVQLVADHASPIGLRSASTSQYILPRLRTIFGEHAFSFSGPKTWNSLSDRFHLIVSMHRLTNVFVIGAIKITYLLTYGSSGRLDMRDTDLQVTSSTFSMQPRVIVTLLHI